MKTPRKLLLASLALAVVFADRPAFAQTNFLCAWKTIQEKVEATNEGKFNQQKVVEELGEVDFLKQQKFETGGPCQKVYISLAEFIDEAGAALTELGMVGYVRMSACLIRIQDDTIPHLKAAFTKGGNFKGAEFDAVMKKLADDARFDFDPTTRTFTSKRSGLVYGEGPKPDGTYNQGETHAVSHVLRGHLDNDFSAATKSQFRDANEVFDLVDDVWTSPNRISYGINGWILDFSPRIVGTTVENGSRIDVTRVRIHVDGSNLRSAFPVK